MNEKQRYLEKMRAKLDELKAEIDSLRSRASQAGADAQIQLSRQIKELDGRIEEGKMKLAALASAGEEAWGSIREGIESSWNSIKSAIDDAASKFKH